MCYSSLGWKELAMEDLEKAEAMGCEEAGKGLVDRFDVRRSIN